MPREIRKFDVGLKAFMIKGECLLMVEENGKGLWELPGGRIDVGEENLSDKEILQREIKEELGENITFDTANPVSTWVRKLTDNYFVFLVGILCKYKSGEIVLSNEHSSFRWVNKNEWRDLKMADGYPQAIEKFWENYKF